MRISAFLNSKGACDYYRSVLPLSTARNNKAAQVEEVWPMHILLDLNYNTEQFMKVMSADIYQMQRISDVGFLSNMIEIIKNANPNGKLVCDFDDNVFDISPLSAHYKDNGTEEQRMVLPNGEVKPLWIDGQNIDLKANKKRIDELKRCVEMFDLITVTTPELAEVFKEYNDNVSVLPNCVDLDNFIPNKFKDGPIRLFWSGGYSHYEDLFILKDVLPEVMKKHDVKLILFGFYPKKLFEKIQDKVEYHEWVPTQAYPYKLSLLRPDISLIPLRNTRFNTRKSPIKFIEMGALSVPSVMSYIPPYSRMAGIDEENGFYIENNDKDAWVRAICDLIEDEGLREKTGAKARKTVEDHFDIKKRYIDWIDSYKDIINLKEKSEVLDEVFV